MRGVAVPGDVHRVRLLAQALGEHVRRVGFVFDEQDTHENDWAEPARIIAIIPAGT